MSLLRVQGTVPLYFFSPLVAGLNHLSVKDFKLIRTVTFEPRDQQHLSKTRASPDGHAPTCDFFYSLHGYGYGEHSTSTHPRPSSGNDDCSLLRPERLPIAATCDVENNVLFGTQREAGCKFPPTDTFRSIFRSSRLNFSPLQRIETHELQACHRRHDRLSLHLI